MRHASAYTLQLMSSPQHCGDLTLPCPSGHFAMSTDAPSSCNVSCTSSLPHVPHVMVPTLIPHFGQLYRATDDLLSRKWFADSTTDWTHDTDPGV